jgi:lipoprotein-anchoring transpeptidase ErfK/SrfK
MKNRDLKSRDLNSYLQQFSLTAGVLWSGLQLLASPVQALPIDRPTAPPASSSAQSGLEILHLDDLAIAATLNLPPLGNPEPFLPQSAVNIDPIQDIRLVIDLSDRRVYVHQRGQLKTSFPIAVGKPGWETPTGDFTVIQMRRDPIWQHPFTGEIVQPGESNPLGARWIGFWTDGTNYIGFHGTPNEETVGQSASHGCIRMFNQDVTALFEMVAIGTPVTVVP